jgi:transcription initiation factor TFIID subunit 4
MSARISNHAQELAKQALNQVIQQKGLDKDMIWELVSKLKRFLNNLIQMASKKGATVKQAVESNVSKLMYNQINEEAFVTNLERILNSSHQDVLLPFLKESVPYLRLFIYQKQQCERYIQSAMSRQVTQQTQQGQQVQGQPSAVADGQEQSGQVVQGGGSSNGVAVKKDLTNQTPPPGLSLPPEVLLRMKQASLAAASQSTSRQGPSGPGASSGNQLSMPGFVDTNKGTSSLAEKVRAAKMVTKSPSKSKSGGKAKTDKSGSSATPINADDDDDDEEEIAGIDLKEETAHFLPSVGVAVASGHCEDETLIPVDLLKRRIARTATKKGIGEVTDEVVTLLSHAVQERLKFVLEKLTLICSHRMQSLKDQDSLSSLSNVKEQLKFLEGIDRCSAQRKQDLEREKVLKAAKSRNKDDPEVARMKEQAKMLQLEKEEEIRKRAANETALAAIQGTRKRPFQADSPVPGSSTLGKGVGDSAGGGAFGTPMGPPRQKQKRRINIRDLIFFLEQEKRSRKSLLLHKSLTK